MRNNDLNLFDKFGGKRAEMCRTFFCDVRVENRYSIVVLAVVCCLFKPLQAGRCFIL